MTVKRFYILHSDAIQQISPISSVIALTMDNYCTGCHGGSAPQGAISLTSYADVVHYAPQITPAIKHTGLYPMPKNAGKLSDCAIRQWDLWLMAGMPE